MNGVAQVSKDIDFARDERLGFLTFSPDNLGSTIAVTAQLKLDKIAQKAGKIDELAERFALKVTKGRGNVFEVENKKRLGLTEFAVVKEFAEAINAMVEAENLL
jgi:arginine kinase